MKFKKNMFLEVSKERISGIEFYSNRILNKTLNIACKNNYYKDAPDIKDFRMDIKNKNLYVLVEGETVYIKMITLPLVKKHLIDELIKNELRYYYKDINRISFTYKLIKKDKFNMEILVFCLNGNSLDLLESSIGNNINIKKVALLQFCIKKYYSSKINDKNYILIFYYNFNLYFLICHNDEIVANTIVRIKDLLLFEFSNVMYEFLEQYNEFAKDCTKIYFANIEELNVGKLNIKGLNIGKSIYLELPYVILENLKREELIKYIIKKG